MSVFVFCLYILICWAFGGGVHHLSMILRRLPSGIVTILMPGCSDCCLMPEVLKMVNGAEEPCSAVAAPMPSAISAVLMRQERMRNSCHPPSVDSSLKRMRYLPGVVMSNSRVCSLADETLEDVLPLALGEARSVEVLATTLSCASRMETLYFGLPFHAAEAKDSLYLPSASWRGYASCAPYSA